MSHNIPHTEETIIKMKLSKKIKPNTSFFKKGNTYGFKKGKAPWNKGLTKETNEIVKRQSESLIGRKLSEEHRRKSIKALEDYKLKNPTNCWKGKKHSEAMKLKLRKAHLGVKLSESHRKAISKGHKGLIKTELHRKHLSEALIGKKLTDEHKLNVSIGTKQGMNNEQTKKKLREHRATQTFPAKDTSIEVKIQNFLKQLGIEFLTHQYININHAYQCDILIPSMNLVIETDGNYWHKYPIGTDIDKIRTSELINKGFKVLRLWEIDINKMDINKFQNVIKDC